MNICKKKRIYLDYASITPIDSGVSKVMRKAEKLFANPSSLYREGVVAKKAIEHARLAIARELHALPDEIIFTTGGTEGNNMAILGAYESALEFFKNSEKKLHIVVSSIEHSSVLECVKHLETKGVEVSYIAPTVDGLIDPKLVRDAIRPETFLVSVMLANNEIGTIEPVAEISKAIRHFKKNFPNPRPNDSSVGQAQSLTPHPYPLLHTDACQAFCYVDINVLTLHVDLLTLDGSKIYGPRGTGILFIKRNTPIEKILHGGGQEQGLRSGTENIASLLGLQEAISIAAQLRTKESARLKSLQEYFVSKLKDEIPTAIINGSLKERLPNNINICIKGLDAEFAVLQFDAHGIALSSASSCLSIHENSYSYVVKELRSGESCSESSLRISFGRTTKKSHIDAFFKVYSKIQQIKL